MGLTIDLPSAGLLGISGAQAFEITANTTMGINKIYVCKQAPDFTITLPTTVTADGGCLLYTSPSPRDRTRSRMPSSA